MTSARPWRFRRPTRSAYAQRLLTFSPQCPYAKAILIENYWERAKPHIAEWEQDANKSPAILAALARRDRDLARYDEPSGPWCATSGLSGLLGVRPLARNDKERGDLEHRQSTLQEFLAETEDHGLTHATAECSAREPFHGAETMGAGMAFRRGRREERRRAGRWCDARCAEDREDWGAGARGQMVSLLQTNRLRRSSGRPRVCRGALQPVGQARKTTGRWRSVISTGWRHTKKAMTWFRKAYESAPTEHTRFNLILLGDEIGDTELATKRSECCSRAFVKRLLSLFLFLVCGDSSVRAFRAAEMTLSPTPSASKTRYT